MAGFSGARRNPILDRKFDQFDDGFGTRLPRDRDGDGFLNEEIRTVVLQKLNDIEGYVSRFAEIYQLPRRRFRITFAMVGQALSEFQASLTFVDAPVDRFARGHVAAMTDSQKRGALICFGEAGCVSCHAVAGQSNEMFSDVENHVLGVPQLAPPFGVAAGNVTFDGPEQNEDFGAEQITGSPNDRYKFRTSPLRNIALQPAFFHNGAFTRLEDAILHHLDVRASARTYNPISAGVDADLAGFMGPTEPVLERLDARIGARVTLSASDFQDLLAFVRDGLLDPRARPTRLCDMVPDVVPSGLPVSLFQGCR
jgi:cytochrome c peroxidase